MSGKTVGIFSHTRPIAKAFLRQIKNELERNEWLKELFPEVLWEDPRKAPKWSEDEGIVVKRSSNPKESSVEAWGLVDGQPTSKHFGALVYDDIVTRESVTTPGNDFEGYGRVGAVDQPRHYQRHPALCRHDLPLRRYLQSADEEGSGGASHLSRDP